MSQPQLRFDFDPLEWGKTRTTKCLVNGCFAIKYLGIPATSVSFERSLSTAENKVTAKRSVWRP